MTDIKDYAETPGTYSEMFSEYLGEQAWISAADRPFVMHVAKLCERLDREGLDTAAMAGSYLQAMKLLDRRRPGATPAAVADDPAQTSIFDHLDD